MNRVYGITAVCPILFEKIVEFSHFLSGYLNRKLSFLPLSIKNISQDHKILLIECSEQK